MQAELIETGVLQRAIEALLFVASESLSIKQLAKLTKAPEVEVTQALAQIEADFAERGIVLREIAGGYRFASAPGARDVVEAYLLPPKTNLSPAALECAQRAPHRRATRRRSPSATVARRSQYQPS